MLCSNICGLRNNFEELKYVIRKRKPDICFLNEIYITEDCEVNDLMLNYYKFYKCNSYSKHTGGVCLYINKNVRHKNVIVNEQQIAWYISFEMCINETPTLLACVYLSASENKNYVLSSLDTWLNELTDSNNLW